MRLQLIFFSLMSFLTISCMGGSDTGNPRNAPNRTEVPEFDSPVDGCQEPFEFVCEDDTVIFKDPVTCEWEDCP